MPTKHFAVKNHHFNKEDKLNKHELTEKPSEILTEWFLDKYYLLVRRISGLSMSIDDYWNTPTVYINQLYNNEMEVIREEQKQNKELETGHKTRRSDHKDDSESALDFEESLYVDFDPVTGEKL